MPRYIDADALFNWGKFKLSGAVKYGNKDAEQQHFSYSTMMMYEIADEIDDAPTADVAPVVRGEWNYAIKNGSCMDYNVTAKCSECGWDWFSKDGIGNYSSVFGAFIINGSSNLEEAEMFLLENARANNKLNYCPNCGAKMEDKP